MVRETTRRTRCRVSRVAHEAKGKNPLPSRARFYCWGVVPLAEMTPEQRRDAIEAAILKENELRVAAWLQYRKKRTKKQTESESYSEDIETESESNSEDSETESERGSETETE